MADNQPDNLTNEPEGLDEFLSSPDQQPGVVNQDTNEPAGLNEFLAPELKEAQYGTPSQIALTAAESAGKGLIGPLAPLAETKLLGVKPEDILAREEVNPVAHYGAELAGLVAPSLVSGGAPLLTQAGALEAVGKLFPKAAGETLASRIGITAAKAAVDNMLIQGSDEVSKMILNDPNQTAQTAMANIGLAGALGGALGVAGGGVVELWNSTIGLKASQVIEDFRSRVNEHITNPDPVATMTQELQDYYTGVKGVADEVYGPEGLKAKDIEKAMPEMSPKINEQVENIAGKLDSALKSMVKDQYTYPPRLTQMIQSDISNFAERVSTPDTGPKEVFNAIQDLKQTFQGYSKFEKRIAPFSEEAGFVKQAKQLQFDLREALEDTSVWGDAAKRQNAINSAFKEYLPTLKDFEKKFTVEVAGERQIDPGKINTYINQLGKPNAEIKQAMLRNFLDASDKYKQIINKTISNLGLDSPITSSPLNVTQRALEKTTLGSKLADIFINKGLATGSGSALGAAIGGSIGHFAHLHGEIGAIIGQHALAPFFKSVLPALAKGLIGRGNNALGFKAATDLGVAAAKGDALLTRGVKNVFKAGSEVLPQGVLPSDKEKEKLNEYLKTAQENPEKLFQSDDKLIYYMPDHAMAMNETVGLAVQYLNGLRTDVSKKSPLDSTPQMSSTQKAEFDNALTLAQQPLMILNKIQAGTLTAQDIKHVATMYPSLYQGIKDKLLNQLVNLETKNKEIPYKTKIGLSMFLAQPMDSTMQPSSIMAAQISPPAPQPPQQTSSKGVKSAPALQKMPGMYQTPGQARLQHKNAG